MSPLEPLRFMSDRKDRPIFEIKTMKYEDKGDVDSILKADENPADFMTPTEPISQVEIIKGLGSAGLRLTGEVNSITRQASVSSKRDDFRNRLRQSSLFS